MRTTVTLAFAALLIGALASPVTAQYSLSTTFASNNGASGNMFDVEAPFTGNGVRITSLDVNVPGPVFDAEVWVVTHGGTFAGHESNAADWTLAGSAAGIVSNGIDLPTPLPIALDISIAPGEVLGLYVTTTGITMRYTNGSSSGGTTAGSVDLEIHEGVGKDYPFGTTFGDVTPGGPSRIWNGTIHYSVPHCDASTPLYELTTEYVASATADGDMFDIEAADDVVIRALDINLSPVIRYTVEVYVVTGGGSFVGRRNTPSAWTLVGRASLISVGVNQPTPLPFMVDVAIPAGGAQGFYVTTTGAGDVLHSASHDFGATAVSDPNIAIKEGIGKVYPFGNDIGTPSPGGLSRIWNGTVHYFETDGGQAPRPDVATLDVGFGLNVAGLPVCSSTPGPYFSTAPVASNLLLRFEGEPGRPIVLLTGDLNVASVVFPPFGHLDIGTFNFGTGQLEGVAILADGTRPGVINSLFQVLPSGRTDVVLPVPPFLAGTSAGFQSIIFNTAEIIGISNAVEVGFVP